MKRNPDAALARIATEVGAEYAPRLSRARTQRARVRICCAFWRAVVRRAVARGVLRREHAQRLTAGMAF